MTDPRSDSLWRLLPATDAATLETTRLSLHHAAQLLASFGQAVVEPRPDDSHRSMTWDQRLDAFRSEPSEDGLRVLLRLPGFTLELWRDGAHRAGLNLDGRSLTDALSWLEDAVGRARSSSVSLSWPDYDLPDLPGGREASLAPDTPALETLAAWYGDASSLLEPLAAEVPEASAVRCWPHHFDLATLLTFPAPEPGGEARYVGLGFSPGDASMDAPYYYVNGWPAPAAADLPPLEGAGSWHSQGWVGAVLTAEEVVAVADAAGQRAVVGAFLEEAASAMRSVVGQP